MTRNFIFEDLTDAVIALDANDIIIDVNPAMRRLFHLSPDAVGKPAQAGLGKFFHYLEPFLSQSHVRQEITIDNGETRHFMLQMLPLTLSEEAPGRWFILHDITEYKRIQHELRFQSSLQDSVTDAVIVTDLDLQIKGWNKAAENVYGWKASEVIGRSTREILRSEFPGGSFEEAMDQLHELGYWKGEVIQYHRDGRLIDILGSVVRFNDDTGQPVGIVAVNHDITERMGIERALAEERNLLRTLIDSLPEAIYIKDLDYRYIVSNHANDRIRQSDPGETAIGKTAFDIFPHDLAERFQEEDKRVMTSGQPIIDSEERNPFNDGWHIISKLPLRNLNGEITGIVGIAHDITARKLIEQKLQHTVEERDQLYQESQQSLAAANRYANKLRLLNGLSQQVGLADTEEALFQIASDYLENIFHGQQLLILLREVDSDMLTVAYTKGITNQLLRVDQQLPIQNTFIGSTLEGKRPVNIGDLVKVEARFAKVIHDMGVRSAFFAPMLVNQKAVGVLCVANDQINGFDQQDEDLLMHVASFLGIASQNLRRSQQLQKARYAAESANRAKSEFLANMSHELRTPLNAILGYVQIMSRDGLSPERQKEGLDVIYQSGNHLLTLINDVLDLSKIEAQHMELKLSAFDLPRMLRNIADLSHMRASEKNLNFIYELLSDLPIGVIGDEVRLRQILLNLLSNAIKYTDSGGIVFKVGYHNNHLRFQVEDTGVGISPDDFSRLFKPFVQVGQRNLYVEGTGLGLSISQQLVSMMGGDLQVKSTPGEGSTFWFEINLPPVTDFIGEVAQPKYNYTGYQGQRRRIMIVDDRQENRTLINNLLEPLGFIVMETANGRECLEKIADFAPDAVVMDLRMPIMGGNETMRHIRSMPIRQPILIAVSASAFDHHMEQSYQAGADDFLSKPFRIERLLDLLGKHLGLQWILDLPGTPGEQPENQPVIPPPSSMIETLYDLSIRGDIRSIMVYGQQLEEGEYPAFGAKLSALAREFKIREIKQFIQHFRG